MSVEKYLERVKNVTERSEIAELQEEFKKFSLAEMTAILTEISKLQKGIV